MRASFSPVYSQTSPNTFAISIALCCWIGVLRGGLHFQRPGHDSAGELEIPQIRFILAHALVAVRALLGDDLPVCRHRGQHVRTGGSIHIGGAQVVDLVPGHVVFLRIVVLPDVPGRFRRLDVLLKLVDAFGQALVQLGGSLLPGSLCGDAGGFIFLPGLLVFLPGLLRKAVSQNLGNEAVVDELLDDVHSVVIASISAIDIYTVISI